MSALVVSLHDVSPLTRDVFTSMLRELAEVGVTKTSLLVIPDHHHRGHILADTSFCRWIEALAKAGHELVVHGYYHQRTPRGSETASQRWVTGVYTMGEGEFFDLPRDEAASLLARAKEDFQRLDAPMPTGFIAPAWLLGREAFAAVRKAGFHYTTYLTCLHDFSWKAYNPEQEFVRSQSLVYSCRNLWRRTCSLLWNATLRRYLQSALLLRLSLHAPDYAHPNIWAQIKRFARAEAASREVTTYGNLVAARHQIIQLTASLHEG